MCLRWWQGSPTTPAVKFAAEFCLRISPASIYQMRLWPTLTSTIWTKFLSKENLTQPYGTANHVQCTTFLGHWCRRGCRGLDRLCQRPHAHTHTHTHTYIYIYKHMCIYIYVSLSVCLSVCLSACLAVCLPVSSCLVLSTCLFVCVYVCMYVCTYACMCSVLYVYT